MSTAPFLSVTRDPLFRFGRPKANGGTANYMVPGFMCSSIGTTGISANRDYYTMWWTPTRLVVDQLACEVSTGAGTNFRIGFYVADKDWQPTGAPLADSGNLSCASTGVKTYTPGSPIFIPPGRYVSVLCSDSAPSVRAQVGGSMLGTPVDSAGGSAGGFSHGYVDRTYAALPTPGTAWDSGVTGPGSMRQFVMYRVTSL